VALGSIEPLTEIRFWSTFWE